MLADTVCVIFGTYALAAGLGMVIEPGRAATVLEALETGPALTYVTGALMFFISAGLLALVNDFTTVTRSIGTVLAGGMVVESLLLLAWPKPVFALGRWLLPEEDHVRGIGLATMAFGLAIAVLGIL
ncbi:hypothetical protein [Hyphomonas johnsonii]|jgi:hypothetical protein|uniref:DUF2065 domain-containing protein n=1 Tax=Hyphomonas johnsonii MHS-2 TaxID=1280950 RepID=A0A059FNY5_9PROT|nr:hypothetical protein [Hyphomonas johnsonii]KCZ92327.1 hypothetical protein HJO_09839 [Hyphomonas johnsonii MHS-2]